MTSHSVSVVVRILLGLAFTVPVVLTMLHAMPQTQMPADALAFADALAKTGYMLPLIWGIEILAGLLFLTGFLVPLAVVLIAPVVVNIAAFHAFLDPGGTWIGVVLGVLELYLAWYYRKAFAPLFRTRARADARPGVF